jgi:hypothetical protein
LPAGYGAGLVIRANGFKLLIVAISCKYLSDGHADTAASWCWTELG